MSLSESTLYIRSAEGDHQSEVAKEKAKQADAEAKIKVLEERIASMR